MRNTPGTVLGAAQRMFCVGRSKYLAVKVSVVNIALDV